MAFKTLVLSAVVVFGGCFALASHAEAQALSEANTPGFFGGYGHFGGYYDTFGEYGGHSTYNGYVRTEGSHLGVLRLVTIPLHRRSHTRTVVADHDCRWLKHRAEASGRRTWKARYRACRHSSA